MKANLKFVYCAADSNSDSECPELAQEMQLNVEASWKGGDSPDKEMGVGDGIQSIKVILSTGK